MEDLGDLIRRLGRVRDELAATAADDFARRHALANEQDRLRDQIARLRGAVDPDADRSGDELKAELRSLEARAKEARSQRIDMVKQAGGGGDSFYDGLGGIQVNRAIDEATGLREMEARITRLRSILDDRDE